MLVGVQVTCPNNCLNYTKLWQGAVNKHRCRKIDSTRAQLHKQGGSAAGRLLAVDYTGREATVLQNNSAGAPLLITDNEWRTMNGDG